MINLRRTILLVVLVVIGLWVQDAKAAACSELMTCDACTDTTFCHWCGDAKCHAIGSIHGCFYGTTCYANDQCVRKEAEYRGYAAPSIAVLLGVCLVGGTAIFCGMASISIAREYANQSAASRMSGAATVDLLHRREPPGNADYMMLSGDSRGTGMRGDPIEDAEVARATKKEAADRPVGAGRVRRSRRGVRARPGFPEPSPLARKILTVTRIVCGTGIAAVLVTCAAVVAFAPHTPGVNVCNTEFDWGSIVNTITGLAPEVDFQILVSVYNPNMLDAKIESGTAILYHKHLKVGTIVFVPTVLPGGFITDMLLPISFETKMWDEAKIGLEYETGKLAFLLDATVSASVMWHGLKTYPYSFSINNYYIKVSDAVGYDRSLCNCQQMLQEAVLPDADTEAVSPDADTGAEEDEGWESVFNLSDGGTARDTGEVFP